MQVPPTPLLLQGIVCAAPLGSMTASRRSASCASCPCPAKPVVEDEEDDDDDDDDDDDEEDDDDDGDCLKIRGLFLDKRPD